MGNNNESSRSTSSQRQGKSFEVPDNKNKRSAQAAQKERELSTDFEGEQTPGAFGRESDRSGEEKPPRSFVKGS